MAHRYLYVSFTWFTENVVACSSCLVVLEGDVFFTEQELCQDFCHEIERTWKQLGKLCQMRCGLCIRGSSQFFGVSIAVWHWVSDECVRCCLYLRRTSFRNCFQMLDLTLKIVLEAVHGLHCLYHGSVEKMCSVEDCHQGFAQDMIAQRTISVKVENQIIEPMASRNAL